MLLIEYPKCSTCRKAKAFLQNRGAAFESRHIVDHPPTAAELDAWQRISGLPLSRFFNTSGQAYRRLGLKEALPALDRQQQLALLASDGMLVKRPLLVGEGFVLVGFREADWLERV